MRKSRRIFDPQLVTSLHQTSLLLIRRKGPYYVKHIAQNLKLVKGQSNFTKFIIVSACRTGSNLLRSLLNSHSQILVFGEIFQKSDRIGWYLPGYSQKRKLLAIYRKAPAKFVRKKVFSEYPRGISAVGFKYMYEQKKFKSWNSLNPFFKNNKALQIIHLKRKNILKSYVSLLTALQTEKWVSYTGAQAVPSPVTINYDECLWQFKKTRTYQEYFDTFFADHPKIEVIYEDLIADRQSEMKRIQSFLGTDYEHLFPSIYKQSHRPLSKAIANYAGLKRDFLGTEWEMFFED
jgi:LPS sulfotransferase NodH